MQSKRRRFEMQEGASSKFWEIQFGVESIGEDDTVTTWWGRIGTDGQAKKLEFDSSDEAVAQYEKLIEEKTKKGYKEVPILSSSIHLIEAGESAQINERDTIGGAPHVHTADDIPICRICDSRMVLFFQFTIRPQFGLPFRDGSHFLAFMCPKDNETSDIFQNDLCENKKLPARFWEKNEGHYAMLMLPPGAISMTAPPDDYLQSKKIEFRGVEETLEKSEDFAWGSNFGFKTGGTPSWINYASTKASCCCGGKLRFVCQVSDSLGFERTSGGNEYLLNGNQIVVLACEKQCHPRALAVVCDN